MMYLSWDEKGPVISQGHLEVMKIKVVVAFPQFPSMLSAFLLTCDLILKREMYSGCSGDPPKVPHLGSVGFS